MRALNLLTRLVFAGLIALCFFPLPQLEGKGMVFRAFFFPLIPLGLFVYWRLRRPGRPYPYGAETLLILPFIVDLFGNVARLYDTLTHYDDVCHFLNWAFLTAGLGLVLSPSFAKGRTLFWLLSGLGSLAITFWEIGEYAGMKLGAARLFLTYEDTLLDLTLSTAGGMVGAAWVVLRRRA